MSHYSLLIVREIDIFFYRSKKEFDKTDNKNIPLSSVQSIEGPTFEKKTGRRGSILGGGNTEDGHVIKLMQKNGFSIDLKVTTACLLLQLIICNKLCIFCRFLPVMLEPQSNGKKCLMPSLFEWRRLSVSIFAVVVGSFIALDYCCCYICTCWKLR